MVMFFPNIVNNFKEKEYIAGIFGGINPKLTWSNSPQPLSWFEAKGKMEQLFKQLNFIPYWETCYKSINIMKFFIHIGPLNYIYLMVKIR
jgi:phenylalanyl-tRNA synthetase beta subunit